MEACSVVSRKEFSKKTRAEVFLRAKGACEKCGAKLKTGEGEYDHILPCALGGDNDASNAALLCVPCHRGVGAKTSDDIKAISKAKRNWLKHNGIKQPATFRKPPKGARFNWKTCRYEREEVE